VVAEDLFRTELAAYGQDHVVSFSNNNSAVVCLSIVCNIKRISRAVLNQLLKSPSVFHGSHALTAKTRRLQLAACCTWLDVFSELLRQENEVRTIIAIETDP
jgi:hypothetical protein